jgi:excisionase family DNA binding protein
VRPLLTAKEVKQQLSLSGPTLYRLADAGILPAVEIRRGKRKRLLRWRPEVVERFISSRERSGEK